MEKCARCGKRASVLDKHDYCEKCHNEIFIARMKKLAGDDSPDVGYLTKRVGLINKYVCRLCGKVVPFAEVSKSLDKRTGYCADCIEKLKEKEKILAGDEETIKKVAEREAVVQELLQAMKEGRVQEALRAGLDDDEPEEDLPEEDFDEDDDF